MFDSIHLMLVDKMRSSLWKLDLGFWTYGLMRLLDPHDPNVVSRRQIPKSRHFLRFLNFFGINLWFWRKWGTICENWSWGSRLMAWYVVRTQVAQIYLVSRPQIPKSRNFLRFHNFIGINLRFQKKWGNVFENWS